MSNKRDEFKNNANNVFSNLIGSVEDNTILEQKDIKTSGKKAPKKDVEDNIKKATQGFIKGIDQSINGYKYKNGKDKTNNYTITFKIDADVEDYLKNIGYISFIENKTKGIDATEYVNNLIRADMLKTLNIDASEQDFNKWIDAYNKYKSKNGL